MPPSDPTPPPTPNPAALAADLRELVRSMRAHDEIIFAGRVERLFERQSAVIAYAESRAREADELREAAEKARDEARAFGEEAARRHNKLLEDQRILRCAFCDAAYPPGTPATQHEALTAHVRVCAAHPMRAVERDLAAAQSALADRRRVLLHETECVATKEEIAVAAAIREEMRAQGAREVEAATAHVRALVDAYSSQGTRHARDAAWSQAHAWLQRQQQPAADAKENKPC